MTTTIPSGDEIDANAAERADDLHRDARPELRGYIDITRRADGSPREIALTVGYGSYSDRGPSRSDVALSYRVDDEGTACVRHVADDTSQGDGRLWTKDFRVLALADDLVCRVPDVERVEPFEERLADLRRTYTAELTGRCAEDGCYKQADRALENGYCRRHDPETDR